MVRAGAQGSGAAGQGVRGGSPGWAGRVLAVLCHPLIPSHCSQGSTHPEQHPTGTAPSWGSTLSGQLGHAAQRGAQDPPAQPSPSPVSSWLACAGGRTRSAGTRGCSALAPVPANTRGGGAGPAACSCWRQGCCSPALWDPITPPLRCLQWPQFCIRLGY